jgi:hypothetical protein
MYLYLRRQSSVLNFRPFSKQTVLFKATRITHASHKHVTNKSPNSVNYPEIHNKIMLMMKGKQII